MESERGGCGNEETRSKKTIRYGKPTLLSSLVFLLFV